MSERVLATDYAPNPEVEGVNREDSPGVLTGNPTAGALIRDAREAAGIHLGALAASLKVPERKLEALEQDRLDLLLDAAFARALASSICRILKIDAGPVLDRLPPNSIHKLKYPSAGAGTPFRPLPEITGQSAWTRISRPVVLSGLALLLGALVLVFMPALKQDGAPVDVGNLSMLPATDMAVDDEAGAIVRTPTLQFGESDAVQGADPVVLPFSGSINGVEAVAGKTPVVAPAAASPSESASSAAASAAGSALPVPGAGHVTFRASDQSWVKVTDANGTVVLRRTLAAGDVAEATGVLPLAAVVGRADVTQVQVHGKAFDLSAVSRDNVARFEVK